MGFLPIRRARLLLVLFIAVSTARVATQSSLPVVPGGEGFGMATRAAYGCGTNPAILRVTNLNDSGVGSLREALMYTPGPRVVIFETSGTITLNEDINVVHPCVTVAGQTAPSPGVTIRNGGLNFYTNNVLVQHLRLRRGDGGAVQPQTWGYDSSLSWTAYGYKAHDIVYDHMSLSWSGAKNAAVMTYIGNVTFWRSFITEALYYASNVIVSDTQPSSLGMHIGGSNGNVSVIGNLFAHNSDRNPEIHEGNNVHVINNVVYDWGKDTTAYPWATFLYCEDCTPGPWKAAVVGNAYIAGPPPAPFTPLYAIGTWRGLTGSQLYISDNTIDQARQPVMLYQNYMSVDPRVSASPVSMVGITVRPSSTIEAFVLANAGARPYDRDAVDTRIVNQVKNRTGRVISSQNEVGGWPTLAVNTRSLTLPSNPHSVTPSGYTNLEMWLHGHAASVEGRANTQLPSPPGNLRIISAS